MKIPPKGLMRICIKIVVYNVLIFDKLIRSAK
jgi:hypothetical protein